MQKILKARKADRQPEKSKNEKVRKARKVDQLREKSKSSKRRKEKQFVEVQHQHVHPARSAPFQSGRGVV